MASYFDEHSSVDESGVYERNQLLELARILQRLISENSAADLGVAFDGLLEGYRPASKDFVSNLVTLSRSEVCGGLLHVCKQEVCPVCLGDYKDGDLCKQLPCKHHFHAECILPWLGKANTCPVCRKEFPTDNAHYEEYRREKEEKEERDKRVEELHNSMFC